MTTIDAAFLDHALQVAREAAAAAEQVVARHYRAHLDIEIKADDSPVTIADREAEQAILAVLRASFPDHAYYGEEFGRSGSGRFLWLIDPIDGTKSFVRRYPMFSTQIALMIDGELMVGVSSAMQYGECAWARRGGGAFINGRPVQADHARNIGQAQVSTGNIKTLIRDPRRWSALGALLLDSNRIRGYGDFLHYHLLASAAVDVVIESDVNILDIAALTVIAREAGAVFTDLDGLPVGLETRSVLAAAAQLHGEVLQRLT
jgi:histidinol-phosphatase